MSKIPLKSTCLTLHKEDKGVKGGKQKQRGDAFLVAVFSLNVI